MEFGDRLKSLREENRLTRNDFAQKLNISYSAISKYETNIRFPDKETLVRMADFFDVSVDYLLCRTNVKETADKIIGHREEGIHICSPCINYSSDKDLSSEAIEEIEKFKEFIRHKYKNDETKG
jgi:transcriptional regulator with XRE-family HTH domain